VKLLTGIGKKFSGRADTELDAEIEKLTDERRRFVSANQALREDAHTGIDASIEQARAMFNNYMARARTSFVAGGLKPDLMQEIAALWIASRPELAADLHAAIDAAPVASPEDITLGQLSHEHGFSPLSREEYERELARLDRALRELRVELERRGIEWRKREAEQELAALEERAEGTPARAAAS